MHKNDDSDDWLSAERSNAEHERWNAWLRQQANLAAERGGMEFSSRFIPGHRRKGAKR